MTTKAFQRKLELAQSLTATELIDELAALLRKGVATRFSRTYEDFGILKAEAVRRAVRSDNCQCDRRTS